jgi:nicotinamide N-methyltransferase
LAEFVTKRTVLELGAGAGLPSLVCAIRGAAQVIVTDYPDADLIENLNSNIQHCVPIPLQGSIDATGYLWGNPVESLLERLPSASETKAFDTLILADLLFNHSEHHKLLRTIELTLARNEQACALVFFTPYRPWLLEKDLAFFALARNAGFHVKQVFEKQMDKVMFEEDPGVSNEFAGSSPLYSHWSRTKRFAALSSATNSDGCHSFRAGNELSVC